MRSMRITHQQAQQNLCDALTRMQRLQASERQYFTLAEHSESLQIIVDLLYSVRQYMEKRK